MRVPFPQTIFALLFLGFYFVIKSIGGIWFAALTQEDQLAENMQFAVLFYTSTLFWGLASVFHPLKYQRWLMRFCALLFLFVAVEEISWGQRLIGWAWDLVQSQNNQNEINLHNLYIFNLHQNLVPYYVASIAIALFPALVTSNVGRYFQTKGPPFLRMDALVAGLVMLVSYKLVDMQQNRYFYEASELCLYGLFALQARALYEFEREKRRPSMLPFAILTVALTFYWYGRSTSQ